MINSNNKHDNHIIFQALYKTLYLILSNSCNNLMKWVLLLPHFTDEEPEAERDEVTLLKSPSWQQIEQGQSPGHLTPEFEPLVNTLCGLSLPSPLRLVERLVIICPINNGIKLLHKWLENRLDQSSLAESSSYPGHEHLLSYRMYMVCRGECSEGPRKLITREKYGEDHLSDTSASKVLGF